MPKPTTPYPASVRHHVSNQAVRPKSGAGPSHQPLIYYEF
jgi:hypothetical protein